MNKKYTEERQRNDLIYKRLRQDSTEKFRTKDNSDLLVASPGLNLRFVHCSEENLKSFFSQYQLDTWGTDVSVKSHSQITSVKTWNSYVTAGNRDNFRVPDAKEAQMMAALMLFFNVSASPHTCFLHVSVSVLWLVLVGESISPRTPPALLIITHTEQKIKGKKIQATILLNNFSINSILNILLNC